jgi:hypothetical protein
MELEHVREVAIDQSSHLLVWPTKAEFRQVYRAAMGVQWDEERRCLSAPPPDEWSYSDWYRQIVAAVADEYRQHLIVGPETIWTNISAELRRTIEAIQPVA